uniref:Uncharacterized protein n=1 Tax=Neolamprologus brichardi TaxID=32507 RepID=A0A3Q4GYF0_NEOBR
MHRATCSLKKFVQMLKSIGQTDVTSAAECDYLLVFCPVVSRVGTDIGEALHNITRKKSGKPVILVVMHHTFDPHHVVAESRRQVNNPNVHLTVDCLFFEGHLLSCNLNDTMSGDIKRFFGSEFPVPGLIHNLISLWQHIPNVLAMYYSYESWYRCFRDESFDHWYCSMLKMKCCFTHMSRCQVKTEK